MIDREYNIKYFFNCIDYNDMYYILCVEKWRKSMGIDWLFTYNYYSNVFLKWSKHSVTNYSMQKSLNWNEI